jgi:hypothetical protein
MTDLALEENSLPNNFLKKNWSSYHFDLLIFPLHSDCAHRLKSIVSQKKTFSNCPICLRGMHDQSEIQKYVQNRTFGDHYTRAKITYYLLQTTLTTYPFYWYPMYARKIASRVTKGFCEKNRSKCALPNLIFIIHIYYPTLLRKR